MRKNNFLLSQIKAISGGEKFKKKDVPPLRVDSSPKFNKKVEAVMWKLQLTVSSTFQMIRQTLRCS